MRRTETGEHACGKSGGRIGPIAGAAAASLAILSMAAPASAASFFFDDGTNQGWERISDATGTLDPAGFNDGVNFTGSTTFSTADPADGDGSAFGITSNPGGPSFFAFRSPDLSGDAMWQGIESFGGQFAHGTVTDFDYFGEARIIIDDTTGGGMMERVFSSGVQPLNTNAWNEIVFSGLSGLFSSEGIASFITKRVIFQATWENDIDFELTFALDNVVPTAADAPPPSVPLPASALLLLSGLALVGGWRLRARS